MDPRVKTSLADLQQQFELSQQVYEDLLALQPVVDQAEKAAAKLKEMRAKAGAADAAKLDEAIRELAALEGGEGRRRRGLHGENLNGVRDSLLTLFGMLQEVDAAPTTQAAAAVPKLHQSTTSMLQQWKEFESETLMPLKVQ